MAVQGVPQLDRLSAIECKTDTSFDITTMKVESFDFQYYLLYKSRLERLRPILENSARHQWGHKYNLCSRVLDAETSVKGREVVIFGTLYKEMKKKKSVLDEYHDEAKTSSDESTDIVAGRYASKDDFLMIEDEHGSLKITGKCLNVHKLFTGIVVALKGSLSHKEAIFHVSDYLLPDIPFIDDNMNRSNHNGSNSNSNSNNYSNNNNSQSNSEDYIAFVSDLRFADIPKQDDSHLNYQLMFDCLGGFLGNYVNDQSNLNSKITRLIIAGNVLGEDEMPPELDDMRYDKKYLKEIDIAREKLDCKLKDLDLWISQITNNLNVDIMPGKIDPTNELLPQRAFHKCLFPLSSQYNSFRCVTNPYWAKLDNGNCCLLGCAGQNVDNMMQHGLMTEIECLELTLRSRNVTPTAPDTLTCFPYRQNDPFLIEKCPNIYFVGSRNKYDSKIVKNKNGQNVLLLCVPSFCKKQEMILVNKNTLECKVVSFGNQV